MRKFSFCLFLVVYILVGEKNKKINKIVIGREDCYEGNIGWRDGEWWGGVYF